jgi:DNA-binding CsgD family transcriptional regulator
MPLNNGGETKPNHFALDADIRDGGALKWSAGKAGGATGGARTGGARTGDAAPNGLVHTCAAAVAPPAAIPLFKSGERAAGRAGEAAPVQLSRRQREVLELLARGLGNKEIARHLGISPKTVHTYRRQLMEILDIWELAGLIRYAILDAGLLPPRDFQDREGIEIRHQEAVELPLAAQIAHWPRRH